MTMKKLLLAHLPVLLSGCSAYNQFVKRIQADTPEYRYDEEPLAAKLNNTRQTTSLVYDNQLPNLEQGMSASGVCYTDGIYVFQSKGDEAVIYRQDRIVLNNCQLQSPKR